jgi:hypothetical protein
MSITAEHSDLTIQQVSITLPEIAATLHSRVGKRASRVPTREVPDWAVRIAARVAPGLATIADLLGDPKRVSTAKVTELLGWQPRSGADTVTATAESLLGMELVRA